MPGYLLDLLQWAVVGATFAALWFIVQYTLTSPWWHDQVGRTVVAMDCATLLLLAPNLIKFIWHQAISDIAVVWTDAGAVVATFFIITYRCFLWWRIERPRSPRVQWRRYQAIRQAQHRHSR